MKKDLKQELKKILNLHRWWLDSFKTKGKQANLSGFSIPEADLSCADLSEADLSNANLYGVDLSNADLSNADLSGADLSKADLSGADLSGADLSGADLTAANLSFTNINSFTLGQHFGYSWINDKNELIIRIGCKEHTADYWKQHSKKIGKLHDYSKKEIKTYQLMIDMLILNNKE